MSSDIIERVERHLKRLSENHNNINKDDALSGLIRDMQELIEYTKDLEPSPENT